MVNQDKKVEIRVLAAEHFESWLPLWKGYLEFYKASVPDSQASQTFDRITDTDGDLQGFGAFDESGKMLGMTTWLLHPTTWSQQYRVYLNDLFTVPEARGYGVARALIEAVYGAARERNADQVYWTTQEFNYAGRMLYDQVAERTAFIKYAKQL